MCVQVVKMKASTTCTTEDVASLNSRTKESLDNVYCITHRLLDTLLAELRTRMSVLFQLSDSIAFLDLVCSHAAVVRFSPNEYARPQLVGLDAPHAARRFAVQQGRRECPNWTMQWVPASHTARVPFRRCRRLHTRPCRGARVHKALRPQRRQL